MKSILDSAFRYTPSAQTDLRKTFARIRREQRGLTLAPRVTAQITRLPSKATKVAK